MEQTVYRVLLILSFLMAVACLPSLFFVSAPYGRHTRKGWGAVISDRVGWIVMESPAVLVFALCFAYGRRHASVAAVVLFAMWETHYIHRAFIYPLGIRSREGKMPISVVAMALLFNVMNGYLNGRWVFSLSSNYTEKWLLDPRFWSGFAIFVAGYLINRHADQVLRSLRKPGESTYSIPYGGLYRWISCPNYLGEILEWVGWAVATWSLPGLAFAVWTAANLAPRAWTNHRWYQERFPDYPAERKALVPGVW
jgi:hypothetical protein